MKFRSLGASAVTSPDSSNLDRGVVFDRSLALDIEEYALFDLSNGFSK